MPRKLVGVVLALAGTAVSTALGMLLAAVCYWGILGFGGLGAGPPSILRSAMIFVFWSFVLLFPLGGLIIGIRWAKALFTDE